MKNNTFTENEVKELIVIQTREVIEKFNNHFLDHQIPIEQLTILFNLKGCTAGQGFFYEKKLRYNLQLAKENLNDFLENMIPHEIVHLYQKRIYPKCKTHGKEFYLIGQTLGYNLNRCHSYDTTNVKRKRTKYLYKCDCNLDRWWVSKRKHNQMQTQVKYHNHTLFSCSVCKGYFKFTGEIEKR